MFYQHLIGKMERVTKPKSCWLVSWWVFDKYKNQKVHIGLLIFLISNPFDITGARAAGWNAIWIDRSGKGWMDQLGEPTKIIRSLEDLPDLVFQLWSLLLRLVPYDEVAKSNCQAVHCLYGVINVQKCCSLSLEDCCERPSCHLAPVVIKGGLSSPWVIIIMALDMTKAHLFLPLYHWGAWRRLTLDRCNWLPSTRRLHQFTPDNTIFILHHDSSFNTKISVPPQAETSIPALSLTASRIRSNSKQLDTRRSLTRVGPKFEAKRVNMRSYHGETRVWCRVESLANS